MARIEFEADTLEQLVDMARQWVAGYGGATARISVAPPQDRQTELRDVLARIVSPASRAFIRAVAERSLSDQVLVVDEAVLTRLGVTDEKAFVGVRGL